MSDAVKTLPPRGQQSGPQKSYDENDDHVDYLLSRGWKTAEGLNPRNPNSLWIDPDLPAFKDRVERVPIFFTDERGQRHPSIRRDDQSNAEQCTQIIVTPASGLLTQREALQRQLDRDQRKTFRDEAGK